MPSSKVKCKTCASPCQYGEQLQYRTTNEAIQPDNIPQHGDVTISIENAIEASLLEHCSSFTDNGQSSSSQTDGKKRQEDDAHQLSRWAYTTSDDSLTLAERLESNKWTSV